MLGDSTVQQFLFGSVSPKLPGDFTPCSSSNGLSCFAASINDAEFRSDKYRGRRLGSEPDNCTECDGTFESEFECCLEVYGQTDLYGLWNDISCTEQKQCVSSQQHCIPCLLAWCAVRNANNRNRQ